METNTLDDYTVQDLPYNPDDYGVIHKVNDKFFGYRALEPDDYSNWMRAIEDASM